MSDDAKLGLILLFMVFALMVIGTALAGGVVPFAARARPPARRTRHLNALACPGTGRNPPAHG